MEKSLESRSVYNLTTIVINATFLQGCDEFTRNFLRKLGVRIPPPEASPDDPYTMHQREVRADPCVCLYNFT